MTGAPGATLLGVSVAAPASESKLNSLLLTSGTSLFVGVPSDEKRLLGLVPKESRVVAFSDDLGRSLLEGDVEVNDRTPGEPEGHLVVEVHSSEVPSPFARRLQAKVLLAVEVSKGETVVEATLAPGEQRTLETPVGPLVVSRHDAEVDPDRFDDDSTGPVAIIELGDTTAIERYLGQPRFPDRAPLRSSRQVHIANGKSRRATRYAFSPTNDPITVKFPIAVPSRETIELEITAGLGLSGEGPVSRSYSSSKSSSALDAVAARRTQRSSIVRSVQD